MAERKRKPHVPVARTESVGDAGQSFVRAQLQQLGQQVSAVDMGDVGTDLLMGVRVDLFDVGQQIGIQVKSGPTSFNRVLKRKGEVTGWWFSESPAQHFDYWVSHHLAHILVLFDLETSTGYWVHVTDAAVQWAPRSAKILVPKANVLNEDAIPELHASPKLSTLRSGTRVAYGAPTNFPLTRTRRIEPHW